MPKGKKIADSSSKEFINGETNNSNNNELLPIVSHCLPHSSSTVPSSSAQVPQRILQEKDFEEAKKGVNLLGLKLDMDYIMKEIDEILPVQNRDASSSENTSAIHFNIAALRIGRWKKIHKDNKVLVVKIFSKKEKKLAWEAYDDNMMKLKIEFYWSDIEYMKPIYSGDNRLHLYIKLNKSPLFYREAIPPQPKMHTQWTPPTDDFTTDNAASSLCIHRLTFGLNAKRNLNLLMRADPKRNLHTQLSTYQINLHPTEDHRRERSQPLLLGSEEEHAMGDNSSYSCSSSRSFLGENGTFPVNNHQPNQNDALGQLFLQINFASLAHDQPHFVNFDGTNNALLYNHRQLQVNPLAADVLQVASTSNLVSPTYAIGNPLINGHRSPILYLQSTDQYPWQQQHINDYEGAIHNHQLTNDCQSPQQHQINRYEGVVHNQPPSRYNCFSQQQNINGYENAIRHHQSPDDFYSDELQINGWENAIHQPTDCYNQHLLNGYDNVVHHQPPSMDGRYSHQHNLNGYENHHQTYDFSSPVQETNGYENSVHQPTEDSDSHQHINGYENGNHHLSTDNCHGNQQHGYENGIHKLSTDNSHGRQQHINELPTDNSDSQQHIDGYEGGLHHNQTTDHCP